jgi:hypothetical protein
MKCIRLKHAMLFFFYANERHSTFCNPCLLCVCSALAWKGRPRMSIQHPHMPSYSCSGRMPGSGNGEVVREMLVLPSLIRDPWRTCLLACRVQTSSLWYRAIFQIDHGSSILHTLWAPPSKVKIKILSPIPHGDGESIDAWSQRVKDALSADYQQITPVTRVHRT